MPNKTKIFLRVFLASAFICVQDLAPLALANPFSGIFPENEESPDFKQVSTVELQADKVGFSSSENKATAEGNVVVNSGDQILYCDQLKIDRSKQIGEAKGNVILDAPSQQIDADAAEYNFSTQTGKFTNARVFKHPFQMKGESIEKVSQDHFVMQRGYMTTCDHDKPHFRLHTKRMDIWPSDRAVARGIKMYLGNVPVMYLPRYTQDLKDKPWFTFIPGRKKDLGYFLLTQTRIYTSPRLRTHLRVDFYERQGIGLGMDHKYNTNRYGSGIVRHYFINERAIAAKHPWSPKTEPTVTNERYKVEWRHKWDVNEQTNAIWQYYRLSDDVILKKYFEREHRRDPDTNTYFLLTRALPNGYASFRMDKRVNRFSAGTDRLPEIKYENSGQEIAESGFYVKSQNTYSNLVAHDASPTEHRRKTHRVDTNNEVYYPTKVAFIEARPFVGGQHTYYSRAIDRSRHNTVRGVFRSGTDLSTKFYRVWNVKKNILGMKIDRLRHVVTPSIAYLYRHRPTAPSSLYNQFDDIDSVDRRHVATLSLENKLQTKRGKNSVDLLRTLVYSDFAFKDNPSPGGFGPVNSDIEFKPTDWLSLYADTSYDHKKEYLTTANFEAYINHKSWSFGLGRRYARDVDDQFTTDLSFRLNPKWRFRIYDRFLVNTGQLKEEEYIFTRDLHEWEMDFIYHQERGGGTEFLIAFRLKAFPDMNMDLFGTSFNRRKAGSQSTQ